MKPFEQVIFDSGFDVNGCNLIEAGAGTGKTYSIQTLFLRLIVVESITVDRILVVTFTEAATKELRERLRAILEKCRRYIDPKLVLGAGDADSARIAAICALDEAKNPGKRHRLSRVRRALLDFDKAAIYTIHGFCQRTLQEFAFECGHDFDVELVEGGARLQEHCRDRWRRMAYGNGGDLPVRLLRASNPKEKRLRVLVEESARRPGAVLLPQEDCNATAAIGDGIYSAINFLKDNRSAIEATVGAVDANSFFTHDRKDRIAAVIGLLCTPSNPDAAESYALLNRLVTYLSPGKITNDFKESESVRECLAACTACKELMQQLGIKAGSDGWSLHNPDFAESVAKVEGVISDNYDEFKAFLGSDDRRYYTSPGTFKNEKLIEKHLNALRCCTSAKAFSTGLNQACKMHRKDKLEWASSKEIKSFIKKVKALECRVATLVAAEEVRGAEQVLDEYRKSKRASYEMTFDDMLQNVETALAGDNGGALKRALRGKYSAALIDEFQDTDAVQYNIFKLIFRDAGLPLFFVGDPRQAIYSFRGGDIFTYTAAVGSVDADRKFSLDTNYRSRKKLIDAVNAIFKDRESCENHGGKKSVFLNDNITYSGELKCNGLKTAFVDNGEVDDRPFKIWNYQNSAENTAQDFPKKGNRQSWVVYEDVANEVVRLLESRNTGFRKNGDSAAEIRQVQPSDIAILVKRHSEAAVIYRALIKRGVRAVRQAGDKIFASAEAMEMLYLLKAMVNPESVSAVRTALVSDLIDISDSELAALDNGEQLCGKEGLPDSIEGWVALFKEAKELWLHRDFSSAYYMLARKLNINGVLAALPQGERRFVNIQQLHDLIHQVSNERHLGPEGVVKWYVRQLDDDTRDDNDAFETILESDDNAVKIMTIFKSKGLEFPVVFVPTMWTDPVGGRSAECRVYHDEESGKTIVHFNKNDSDAKERAEQEKREEEVRNLYVAATRASHRTYLIAGELCSRKSVLSGCISPECINQWRGSAAGIEIIDKDFIPGEVKTIKQYTSDSVAELAAPEADVDVSRGHASFSSIAPKGHGAADEQTDLRDYDAGDTAEEQSDPDEKKAALDIFSFPAGARTGECWHKIFELLDFGAGEETIRAVVNEQLALFGQDNGAGDIPDRKRQITFEMVRNVLQAGMQVGDAATVKLADIAGEDKLAELAFDFALKPSGGNDKKNAVYKVLCDEWGNAPDGSPQRRFLHRLKNWQTEIPGGFMTGFIDLVFRKDDRYYLLDWKSNSLEGKPHNFVYEGMVNEMAEHAYFLQYLIYTVALHLYLGQSLPDYDYDSHFGGVLYIFLRGVNQTKGSASQNGIFYDKPSKLLVEKLSAVLTG